MEGVSRYRIRNSRDIYLEYLASPNNLLLNRHEMTVTGMLFLPLTNVLTSRRYSYCPNSPLSIEIRAYFSGFLDSYIKGATIHSFPLTGAFIIGMGFRFLAL